MRAVPNPLSALAGRDGRGPTTVELVAAVSNAGGLGTLGAYMEPVAIRDSIQEIRKRTDQPLPSTFCARCRDRHERIGEVQQELNRMRDDLGIPHAGKDRVATRIGSAAIRGSDRRKGACHQYGIRDSG